MSYVSRHTAVRPPPVYKLSRTANRHREGEATSHEFSRGFRGSAASRPQAVDAGTSACRSAAPERTTGNWPTVFAVALVANLVAPALTAAPARPLTPSRLIGRETWTDIPSSPGAGETSTPSASPLSSAPFSVALDHVEIRPVERPLFKTDYTFPDVMRAIASAGAPFRHLGRLIGDVRAVATGESMDPKTLDDMERAGDFADKITALVPAVLRARLPGYLAEIAADTAEGKVPTPDRMVQVLSFADPRTLGAQVPMLPDGHVDVAAPEMPDAAPGPVQRHVESVPLEVSVEGAERLPARPADADLAADSDAAPSDGDGADKLPPSLTPRVEGEHEYLEGYEQALPSGHRPVAPSHHPIVVEGRHYLAGAAGYYHVTREPNTGQWLINAPRGTRAQVPVTYDAETGTWHAQAPLRLCGGGCGPSRESTPDSVAMSQHAVGDAIRHLSDTKVRDSIQLAYADLSHLHLLRTNREDLKPFRDNSIVGHRRMLIPQLMRLDPYSTLFEQQREAAEITAIHYDTYPDVGIDNLSPEAFCQENAEILFHYLLTRGVPSHHIRMITLKPQNRPPHVMVLYTESDQFIDLLDLSTPQVMDAATGVVPQVRQLRLPGDIAQIALNRMEGKRLELGEVSTLMQYLDPKSMGGDHGVAMQAPQQPHAFAPDVPVQRQLNRVEVEATGRGADPATPEATAQHADPVPAEAIGEQVAGEAVDASDVSDASSASGMSSSPRGLIEGEHEYLAGYAQEIDSHRFPSLPPGRFAILDGQHYIAGENGYYRVTHGQGDDIWLVDAPRGSRAPVPVTFDPATRRWRASAPLRLCGGGCGQSKLRSKSDSITDRWPDISSAISHLRNEDTQNAIRAAFGNLGNLRLLRGNREDLRPERDYSIVGHRAALQKETRGINRNAPLLQQQQQVAAATAMYYSYNPLAEAFCQENAEILFHLLLEGGIPKEHLRMISVHPQNRPSHVMVLYTESEAFIRMLHLATPPAQIRGRQDGIGDRLFSRAIFLSRDSTVLLDPWGKTKAIGFADAATDQDVERTLDTLLTNIGRRDQRRFAVSITRPLATRSRSANGVFSPASSGSAGSSVSALDPSIEPDDWSSSSGSDDAI